MPKYYCNLCNYKCERQAEYMRHIKTQKHMIRITAENNGKSLHDRENIKEMHYITAINELIQQNNKFNINFFLNEQCKDAISLMDFVSSLQLQLSDLENTAKLGYVDGITKIILDGIKDMDVYKRPIHCTDLKRETIYIKDQNSWEKENEDKTHLRKAINIVSHKNIQQIPRWQEENPDCMDVTHPKSMEYLNIMINANGGNTTEIEKNTEKIIKNLAKEVTV